MRVKLVAFLKTIFAFLKTILEGKFSFSKNLPQYMFTLYVFKRKAYNSLFLIVWTKVGRAGHFPISYGLDFGCWPWEQTQL